MSQEKTPTKNVPTGVGLLIIAAVIGGVIWMFASVSSRAPAPQATAPTEPGGITIPSDPHGTYFVLEKSGPPTARVIVTKRRGKDGTFTYSKRLYDCGAAKFKYLGTGDTIEQMNASKPDPNMGELTTESISSYVGGLACKE